MAHGPFVLFLAVSLAAVLTPGPAMLAILGHALARGARATLPVVLGNAAGAVLLMSASVAGLAAWLAALPHGLTALKWGGAAYLLWLGVRAWRVDGPAAPVAPAAVARGFVRGVLIALSNPKAVLFFGAVLPQLVDAARDPLPQLAVMASTFAALELTVTATVAFAAQGLAPLLRQPVWERRVKRAGGAVMAAAAVLLALV